MAGPDREQERALVDRILFLAGQVAQTEERGGRLKTRLPLGVETPSLNYECDVQFLKAEYNQAVAQALALGYVTEESLRAAGLPVQMPT